MMDIPIIKGFMHFRTAPQLSNSRAMRKAKGMEAYRPALTRGAGERGELHWSEEIRARILDVFLQYGEQLKQLPYGQKRFTIDLNGLEYVLVFTASHALYKWPIEQL